MHKICILVVKVKDIALTSASVIGSEIQFEQKKKLHTYTNRAEILTSAETPWGKKKKKKQEGFVDDNQLQFLKLQANQID